MAKERLSKLQKWILNRCLENKTQGITRDEIREFFGKRFSPKKTEYPWGDEERKYFNWDTREYPNGHKQELFWAKPELRSTRSIEASISRSFNNLIKRELLTKKYHFGQHFLTEAGFLKVNRKENPRIVNTYENYVNAINKANEEMGKYYKKLIGDLKNITAKRKS
jgi:hypothetical protein